MVEDAGEFPGASAGSAHSSRDKAFEIFVKRTITSIQKEAWGRSKEVKEIREACQTFLNTLDQAGCTEETLKQVLYPLQLACSSGMQKVVELALGCLHKLVAHAWLHGESAASGAIDILTAHGSLDDDDTVANVIKMVIKCGESNNEALQLAVVRALLTFTTAEHFIAHGECLLAAVRAVFNLALDSENPVNKRTACNALFQMLNTICRRVTQIQPRPSSSSECSMRTVSDTYEMARAVSGMSFNNHNFSSWNSGSGTSGLGYNLSQGVAMGSGSLSQFGSGYLQTAAGQQQLLQYEIEATAAAEAGGGAAAEAAHCRAVQLAQLAECKDLQGLEAALEQTPVGSDDAGDDAGDEGEGSAHTEKLAAEGISGCSFTAVQAQALTAGEAAGSLPLQPSVSLPGSTHQQQIQQLQQRLSGPAGQQRPGQRSKLTTQEKDVLLVLTAFCKLASREAPGASVVLDNSNLSQGKLLALEMLAKVGPGGFMLSGCLLGSSGWALAGSAAAWGGGEGHRRSRCPSSHGTVPTAVEGRHTASCVM
jgi:hypothetical protein